VNEGVYGTKTKFEKGFAYAFADFDEKHTVTSITLPANVAEFNLLQFGTTYHDDYSIPLILYLFYEREGKKKAGTYVKTRDGIWRVQYGG
jgi:hypothetical protein